MINQLEGLPEAVQSVYWLSLPLKSNVFCHGSCKLYRSGWYFSVQIENVQVDVQHWTTLNAQSDLYSTVDR